MLFFSCGASRNSEVNMANLREEPVVMVNDSLAYEVIIIDVGFSNYLNTVAKPIWYYSEAYYRNNNIWYVNKWNSRVGEPEKYDMNIYEQRIEYEPNIDYGLEVNYKLYNYFKFVELKYRINF